MLKLNQTLGSFRVSIDLRTWSHLLKKSLMENFIFCAVITPFFTCYLLSFQSLCTSGKTALRRNYSIKLNLKVH